MDIVIVVVFEVRVDAAGHHLHLHCVATPLLHWVEVAENIATALMLLRLGE